MSVCVMYEPLLYISTSFWVLHTPRADHNLLFGIFARFCSKNEEKRSKRSFLSLFHKGGRHKNAGLIFKVVSASFFFNLVSKSCKNLQKIRFQPVSGVCSSQMLVEIYNRPLWQFEQRRRMCLK